MSNINGSNAIDSGIGTQTTSSNSENNTANINIPNIINLTNDSLISNDTSNSDSSSASNTVNRPPTSLGFCHSCNKQIQINIETYTCTQCNGGFIELFDINDPPQAFNSESSTRPIDRLIDNRPIEISDDERSTSIASNINSNSDSNPSIFVINSSDINTGSSESSEDLSPLTSPLFQLMRRLHNRRNRASNLINNELSNEIPSTPPVDGQGTDSESNEWSSVYRNATGLSETAPQPQATSNNHSRVTFSNFGRLRPSFHYRLRRHGHGPSSSGMGSGDTETTRRIPIQRHTRFHRSPAASRVHFNFLDDDELLNQNGAIIITTLINQLRNTNRGAAPASDTQIQNLPNVEIDQTLVDKISQCAVCMEDFLLKESVKQLPCKHLYHDSCIDQWLKLHATCPICRKNINGDENSEQEQPDLLESRPILNLIPYINRTSSASEFVPLNLNPNRNEPQTANMQSRGTTSTSNRRQPIRNRQLYRIQIGLNNQGVLSQPQVSLNQEGVSRSSQDVRARQQQQRQGDTIASTMVRQERQHGIRTSALLINPQWTRSDQNSNSTESNEINPVDLDSLSAFSLMNGYRDYRNRPTSQNDSSVSSSGNTNRISGNSRLSQMMDRLLSRYRSNRYSHHGYISPATRANRSSDTTNPIINTSVTFSNGLVNDNGNRSASNINNTHSNNDVRTRSVNVPSQSSISLRLGQLFRNSRHMNRRNNINPNNSERNTQTNTSDPNHTDRSPNELTSNHGSNTDNTSNSDFYEIFRLEPEDPYLATVASTYRNPIQLPLSQRARASGSQNLMENDDQTTESNESFTEDPNNYFDFSLFNRSQTLNNNILSTTLDRLFDTPEDVQQINSDEIDDDILDLDEELVPSPELVDGASPLTRFRRRFRPLDESVFDRYPTSPELMAVNGEAPLTRRFRPLDESVFEQYPTLASTAERRSSVNELDDNESNNNIGVSQAKKRKTEST